MWITVWNVLHSLCLYVVWVCTNRLMYCLIFSTMSSYSTVRCDFFQSLHNIQKMSSAVDSYPYLRTKSSPTRAPTGVRNPLLWWLGQLLCSWRTPGGPSRDTLWRQSNRVPGRKGGGRREGFYRWMARTEWNRARPACSRSKNRSSRRSTCPREEARNIKNSKFIKMIFISWEILVNVALIHQ